MKTKNIKREMQDVYLQTRRLFFTGYLLIAVATGWILGSTSTIVCAENTNQKQDQTTSFSLPVLSMNGERIPTILLPELSIEAVIN